MNKLTADHVLNDPRVRAIADEVLFSGNYDHLTAQEARLVIQLRAERLPPEPDTHDGSNIVSGSRGIDFGWRGI